MNTYHYHVIIQISTTVYKRTSPLTTRFCCLEFPKSFCDERLVGIKACQTLWAESVLPLMVLSQQSLQCWSIYRYEIPNQSIWIMYLWLYLHNYVLVFFKCIDVCWETCSSLSSLVSISPHKGEHEICSVQNHPKTWGNIKDTMNLSDKSQCSDDTANGVLEDHVTVTVIWTCSKKIHPQGKLSPVSKNRDLYNETCLYIQPKDKIKDPNLVKLVIQVKLVKASNPGPQIPSDKIVLQLKMHENGCRIMFFGPLIQISSLGTKADSTRKLQTCWATCTLRCLRSNG